VSNLSGLQKGIVLIIILLMVLFAFKVKSRKNVEIFISRGSSFTKIFKILKENKVLNSITAFDFWVKIWKAETKLKPGLYIFKKNDSGYNVAKILLKGKAIKIKVTIPEGFRTEQIAEVLEKKELVNKEKFLEIVEDKKYDGRLFPETYFFSPGVKEEEIIEAMYKNFRRFYDKRIKEKAQKINMTEDKVVILASIIEREAKKKDEKYLISGIFYNRLKKRWRLESCATVRFALKKWKRPLTFKDLKTKSPYNTYRHFGLPPSPICNPGRISLLAAVEPVKTDLFFFVSKGEGTHRFSIYFKEHIRKKFEEKKKRKKKEK